MLVDRTKLLPSEVVSLFMDVMNDPHPQMRSTVQGRMMLVCSFGVTFNFQYLRLLSNMGFARNVEELHLRETHFPNEVIVYPSKHEHFTETYIAELNTPPYSE